MYQPAQKLFTQMKDVTVGVLEKELRLKASKSYASEEQVETCMNTHGQRMEQVLSNAIKKPLGNGNPHCSTEQ